MNKFIFSLLLFFLFIISSNLLAQEDNPNEFLINIGILDTVNSEVLQETREFWVHYPRTYNPNGQLKYPVVYLLDGGVLVGELAAVLAAQSPGFVPEMIIVGISNQRNRTRDLTTSEIDMSNSFRPEESGGAEDFSSFIASELIPHVEENYPVTDYRTLIGHSYGGLFTVNVLMQHNDLFRNYIAIDPSLGFDNQKLLKEFEANYPSYDFDGKSLFLTLANAMVHFSDDMDIKEVVDDRSEMSLDIRSNLEFANFLDLENDKSLDFAWNYFENEIHGTVPLISMLEGLKHIFRWYPIKSPYIFNNPETPYEDLIANIEERTTLLTEHFGYPVYGFEEDLINMLGYMSMDMDNFKKAEAFFKLNVKYYKESPNAYDSFADYYVRSKDYDNALKMLEKAYSISQDPGYQARMDEVLELKNK